MFGFETAVNRAGGLEALCGGYGKHTPRDLVDEAVRIIELERLQTAELAERGLQPWVGFVAHGNLEVFTAEASWIRENQQLLAR
jgi:hypothetical protein